MRELVTLQVGQCGNQIGARFWELAAQEHELDQLNRPRGEPAVYDDALSTFFRNVEPGNPEGHSLPPGSPLDQLQARAVLLDTEEGVVGQLQRDPKLRGLFAAPSQFLTPDVSGAGNNWAHGFYGYGPKHEDLLRDSVRIAAEQCDSLQSFLLIHSLGGGTGSGMGTYLLQMLADDYPEVFRFCTSVFPSADDDVVTSPYNSVCATAQLIEHADCVLPLDNEALGKIANRIVPPDGTGTQGLNAAERDRRERARAFDAMNGVAAHLLLDLTASMRFGGSLNVDLNEITMNLVPFPKLHFIMSSLAPVHALYSPPDVREKPSRAIRPVPMRSLDQMFSDVFSPDNQLMRADPRKSVMLSVALMARGQGIEISDIRRNIDRLGASQSVTFAHWNTDAWKVGHCSQPPLSASSGHPRSLLCLANSCAIADRFQVVGDRFDMLFKRKAHLHHYTEFMDVGGIEGSRQVLEDTIASYSELAQNRPKSLMEEFQRFVPLG